MPKKTSIIKIESLTDNPTLNLALDTIKKGKQALVFVNTKRSAEKTAEEVSFKSKSDNSRLNELSEAMLHSLSRPTKQCERLAKVVKKGIAFHHAGLISKQKELIEDNFRNGLIKIICCTPTLAFGLSIPAFRVITKDLRRYGHSGLTYIPVLEYLQMSGRAGRPEYNDKYGEAICIAYSKANKKKLIEKYIKGVPEEIYSKLAVEPVLRMYVLSLIVAEFVNTKQDLFDFFSKTFFAYQFCDLEKINTLIEKILNLLEEWEFISSSEKGDFRSADELENEKYTPTLLGKRVAELYIDPLTAHNFVRCIKKATKKVIPFSFLQMISSTLEIRPLLRARMKEYDKINEALVKYGDFLLEKEPSPWEPEYEDFINSIKTALFFNDWINEKDEEFLLETYSIRPGEINVKLTNGDWLLYGAEELSRILREQKLIKEIVKLRIRLKNGVKEELIPLLKLEQIGRVRARALYRNGIKDIADVKKADFSKLAYLLGKNIALNVKKQVGEDYSKIKVKEHKRKGQISLKDY